MKTNEKEVIYDHYNKEDLVKRLSKAKINYFILIVVWLFVGIASILLMYFDLNFGYRAQSFVLIVMGVLIPFIISYIISQQQLIFQIRSQINFDGNVKVDFHENMLSAGWLDVKTNQPPEETPILIVFNEYGRELNTYKVKEAMRRGTFYYQPDFNGERYQGTFYDPDYWRPMFLPYLN